MNYARSAITYLIAINVVIFALMFALKVSPSIGLALYFPKNPAFEYWQLFTHMFIHGGITHLLFNMYALWAFGTPLMQRWGNTRFLAYFLVTGLGAGLVYTLANYWQFQSAVQDLIAQGLSSEQVEYLLRTRRASSEIMRLLGEQKALELFAIYRSPVIGASGAVYGVLVAFAMYFPRVKLTLMFLPFPIKAMYFVPLIIVFDLFFGVTRYSVGNIAHLAHVGGALVGMIVMLAWRVQVILKAKRQGAD